MFVHQTMIVVGPGNGTQEDEVQNKKKIFANSIVI